MKSLQKLLIAATTMTGVAMLATPAQAITNGQPDGEAHGYVGLVVFDAAPGMPAWRCSGILVSPTVVVTSGACTDGTVAARVWFAADVTYDAVPFPLYPYGGPGSGAVEGVPHTHPLFGHSSAPDRGNGLPSFLTHDVGVVVLEEPVVMAEYGVLPSLGLVDTLPNQTDVELIGYGVQEQIKGATHLQPSSRWTGPRIRMYAPSDLIAGQFVHSAEFLKVSLNASRGTGGFCYGDNGGPTLLGGTSTILAVNSYTTNGNCAGVGYSSRIDTLDVLEWLYTFPVP